MCPWFEPMTSELKLAEEEKKVEDGKRAEEKKAEDAKREQEKKVEDAKEGRSRRRRDPHKQPVQQPQALMENLPQPQALMENLLQQPAAEIASSTSSMDSNNFQ